VVVAFVGERRRERACESDEPEAEEERLQAAQSA
jgi:hypothetical protein